MVAPRPPWWSHPSSARLDIISGHADVSADPITESEPERDFSARGRARRFFASRAMPDEERMLCHL